MATVALTQNEFIQRCKKIHGNTYSYKKVLYTTTKNTIVITCKQHGDFEQKAAKHLRGQGCKKCASLQHSEAMSNRSSCTEREFLIQLDLPKEQKYLGPFVNLTTKVALLCRKHGQYQKSPKALLKNSFCPSCSRKRLTTAEFVLEATRVHGLKYDYSKVEYKNITTKMTLICPKHGCFLQNQSSHLAGKGCPDCGNSSIGQDRFSLCAKNFVSNAKTVHGNMYDYSKSAYRGRHRKLEITCALHGVFWQTAGNHLSGQGCPVCTSSGYSKLAIRWIEQETKLRRLKNVWHAENGGEFLIPETRFSADGYHAQTKTIFEFYGDRFHGNPKVYRRSDRPHPFTDKTANELYKATMRRERRLRALGYTVISIWESEYRRTIR